MSIEFTDEKHIALVDSVTGWAFGTVFASTDHAEDFLRWLGEEPRVPVLGSFIGVADAWKDARCYPNTVLEQLIARWLTERVDAEGDLLPAP